MWTLEDEEPAGRLGNVMSREGVRGGDWAMSREGVRGRLGNVKARGKGWGHCTLRAASHMLSLHC